MSNLDLLRDLSPTISVGILTADLMRLESELRELEKSDVQLLHFDVMDGCFAPMMTVGPPFIKQVRSRLLKDVHLMVQDPLEKIRDYVAAGADIISIHVESCTHVHRVLQQLASLTHIDDPDCGLVRGVALNPGTPIESLEPLLDQLEMVTLLAINPGWGGQAFSQTTFSRIRRVQKLIGESGKNILLCVDGGITRNNIAEVAGTGVDVVVTGSAVFDGKAPLENARFMLKAMRDAG